MGGYTQKLMEQAGFQELSKTIIQLSSAQLLLIGDGSGLNQIPFIPAPPAGKRIVVWRLSAKYKFGLVAYTLAAPTDQVSLNLHNIVGEQACGGVGVGSLGFLDQVRDMVSDNVVGVLDATNVVRADADGSGVDVGYVGTLTLGDGTLELAAYWTLEDAV